MKNLLRLPRWGLMSLIVLTIILSFVILAKIWFPDLLPEDLFWKIFLTYLVLVLSSSLIAKMTEYLKNMGDDTK